MKVDSLCLTTLNGREVAPQFLQPLFKIAEKYLKGNIEIMWKYKKK